MKIIAIEEHFITCEHLNYLRSRKDFPKREIAEDEKHNKIEKIWYSPECCFVTNPEGPDRLLPELGSERLKEMDKAGISMQILSLTAPGVENFNAEDGKIWARRTNDELAAAVKKHPDRFAGLAALPFQAPEAAADELERAVSELGLKGAMVNSNIQGEYLDDPKFWVIFEKAEKLGVPIYIHPREPSPAMIKPYLAYPGLWTALLGYGAEVSLHAMRLICSGVFDRYPGLNIVIGHMGEALPFWLWRLDRQWLHTPMAKKLSKKPSEYIKDNFRITTSGMFSIPPFLCSYLTLGADNILFAVDFPYESSETAVNFIQAAPISDRDKEKICHLNAEKLLGL